MRYGGVRMRGLTKKGLVKSLNEANDRAYEAVSDANDTDDALMASLDRLRYTEGALADADALIIDMAQTLLRHQAATLDAIGRMNGTVGYEPLPEFSYPETHTAEPQEDGLCSDCRDA